MRLPFAPPLAPMLSSAAEALPGGDGWQFEPKWDGFRTLVFRDGDEILLQSRDEKPMNRYFPELVAPLIATLPERCVVDGEIVIVGVGGLDFETLLFAAAFTATVRKQLVVELTPLRADALEDHPWRDWAVAQEETSAKGQRLPGATSRWNRGKDLSWEPLRPERVCEVAYDHMQGTRFRHAAKFLRWRPDKRPQDCRYDQLEVTPAYELDRVFGARDRSQPCAPASQGS